MVFRRPTAARLPYGRPRALPLRPPRAVEHPLNDGVCTQTPFSRPCSNRENWLIHTPAQAACISCMLPAPVDLRRAGVGRKGVDAAGWGCRRQGNPLRTTRGTQNAAGENDGAALQPAHRDVLGIKQGRPTDAASKDLPVSQGVPDRTRRPRFPGLYREEPPSIFMQRFDAGCLAKDRALPRPSDILRRHLLPKGTPG